MACIRSGQRRHQCHRTQKDDCQEGRRNDSGRLVKEITLQLFEGVPSRTMKIHQTKCSH